VTTVEVTRTGDGLRLTHLDLFFVELLRQVPVSADPADSQAARSRLYPPLCSGNSPGAKNPAASQDPAGAGEANEEWRTYVHPELQSLFTTSADIVREDLETFEQETGSEANDDWVFEIPADHFDQWLNVLNQARLSLAARFGFEEKEMNQSGPRAIETVRDLSLFQIHFYGFLQECILQDLGE
jgi:hypothetical protein